MNRQFLNKQQSYIIKTSVHRAKTYGIKGEGGTNRRSERTK